MKIISAKKLSEALAKAQGVGLVEERFTISDCEVVLRNLRPDEYEAIINETKEYDDLAYLNAYQRAHIARSVVEINGMDLRDVKFVEVEEDDPKKPGQLRTVRVELHTWVDQNILSTWSKEAITIGFRKVGDVVTAAEEKAKEGIQFRTPEETPEERFRRIVGEMKDAAEDVPVELVTHIMEDLGYLRKTTLQEAEAVDVRLSRLAAEQAAQEQVTAPVAAQPPPEPEKASPAAPTPQELMARRAPMNRVAEPSPIQSPTVQAPAILRAPPPEAAPIQATNTVAANRSAKIAALEGDMMDEAIAAAGPPARPQVQEVAELSHKVAPVNPQAVAAIMDQPPVGGINPRFHRSPR